MFKANKKIQTLKELASSALGLGLVCLILVIFVCASIRVVLSSTRQLIVLLVGAVIGAGLNDVFQETNELRGNNLNTKLIPNTNSAAPIKGNERRNLYYPLVQRD